MSYQTYPDWGVQPGQIPSPGYDSAENAVRLGSPVALRRDGKVIWFDTFDAAFTGWSYASASSWSIRSTRTYSGSGSALCGLSAIGNATIYRPFPILPSRRWGFEFLISIGADDAYITTGLIYYDGGDQYNFTIRINASNGQVQYRNSGGTYTLIGTISNSLEVWTSIKLVADLETGKLVRVMFDETVYELDAAIYVGSGTTDDHVRLWCDVEQTLAGATSAWFDNFIVTIDEV